MASLQKRGKTFSCVFYWQGKRQWLTLGNVTEREADAKAAQVDYILMRLKQGLVELPAGVDIVDFVGADGKAPEKKVQKVTTDLGALKTKYLAAHSSAHESSSLTTTVIHFGHFAATLGERFVISGLTLSELQRHVDRRAADEIAPATIKKEIHTLRAAWNWGRRHGLVSSEFPGRGLVYGRSKEKPPFQTREEIERQISRGGLTEEQVEELWDSLYLTADESGDLLEHVRGTARYPWIYAMAVLAAHTGARRSEMIRAQVGDVDFEAGVVTLREKKRVKGRETTRRVPITPLLEEVLRSWLASHPGGNNLFCRGALVARSRTRRGSGSMLTRNEAHDHLQRTLSGSKWSVLKGWHVLRHSFISACATKAVDQRLLDEWVGHQTDEQRRRYRHLYPSVQKAVLASVFQR